MNYESNYNFYYNNFYSRLENRLRLHLIAEKNKKINFIEVINETQKYLSTVLINKLSINSNKFLYTIYLEFEQRHGKYEADEINLIFENKLKTEFEQIDLSKLTFNYNLKDLVVEIAILNAIKEISRILQVQSKLYEMHYKLNDFSEFEIRDHKGIMMENYPIYKKLHKKLYPEYYKKSIEVANYNEQTSKNESGKLSSRQKTLLIEQLILNVNKWQTTSERTKAKILSRIVEINATNIRNTLALTNKKSSIYSKEFKKDIEIVNDIIKLLE